MIQIADFRTPAMASPVPAAISHAKNGCFFPDRPIDLCDV